MQLKLYKDPSEFPYKTRYRILESYDKDYQLLSRYYTINTGHITTDYLTACFRKFGTDTHRYVKHGDGTVLYHRLPKSQQTEKSFSIKPWGLNDSYVLIDGSGDVVAKIRWDSRFDAEEQAKLNQRLLKGLNQ